MADDAADGLPASDLVAGAKGYVVFGHPAPGAPGPVAIWQLSATGYRGGAWVFDLDDVTAAFAAQMLSVAERRVVAGVGEMGEDAALLQALASRAGVALPDVYWNQRLDLSTATGEVSQERAHLEQAITDYRATTKKAAAPLSYKREVPQATSTALQDLLEAHKRRPPATEAAAAAEALGKAYLLQSLVELWSDTEAARVRRKYLHEPQGKVPRPLPPSWMARHRDVYAAVLDL